MCRELGIVTVLFLQLSLCTKNAELQLCWVFAAFLTLCGCGCHRSRPPCTALLSSIESQVPLAVILTESITVDNSDLLGAASPS